MIYDTCFEFPPFCTQKRWGKKMPPILFPKYKQMSLTAYNKFDSHSLIEKL